MKFSEDLGGSRYRISAYGEGWVKVNQDILQTSFLVSPQTLVTDWQPRNIHELEPAHLEPLFAIGADIILIGTGITQHFPSPAIWKALVQHGIGFEIMTTDAACRTYNVLLSEARRVAAAFLLAQ
jgi:uncharacterized protein